MLILILVYEKKVKEEVSVYKVRLVANGSKNRIHSSTFAPTLSREELFIVLHITAIINFDSYHLDKERTFVNVKKQDVRPRLAKIPSVDKYYEVAGA